MRSEEPGTCPSGGIGVEIVDQVLGIEDAKNNGQMFEMIAFPIKIELKGCQDREADYEERIKKIELD